jgi:hypothetical protein
MMFLQATREEIKHVRVSLELPKESWFKLPAGSTMSGDLTVKSLRWDVTEKKHNTHPIDAKAVGEDGCGWTLSLRMIDLPLNVKTALISACQEGDIS